MPNKEHLLHEITPAALLSCMVLIVLWGCEEKKTYKIGISQCSNDDWRQKMNEEVIREAMLHNEVVVEIRSADVNSRKQIEDIASNSLNLPQKPEI